MKQIDSYILEKLKIDNETEVGEGTNYVHPDDKDAEDVCNNLKSNITMFCKYRNGANNVGKIKIMLGDGHYFIKPASAKNIYDELPEDANVSISLIKELANLGLGDSYVIDEYEDKIDTSSRINNLKRRFHYFLFNEFGMIFKDKKEANKELRQAKEKNKVSTRYRFKVITIEEASKMESSIYGDSIREINFFNKTFF